MSQQHPPPPALKPPPPILEPPIPLPQDPPAPKALPQPQGLRPTALQHCPRKLNRSSRDFRLPVEKEAGGGGLDNRRYPYNLKGVRGERPNYAPQGAWGRHPVTGAGMANFLVTQPGRLVGVRARKGRLLPSQRKYACPSLLLPYPGHNVICTDVCGREAGRLRLKVKLMYLKDSGPR